MLWCQCRYELNQRIVADPTLLVTHPETSGHVAIVSPKLKEKYSVTSNLMTQAQYVERCDRALQEASAATTGDLPVAHDMTDDDCEMK